MPTTDRDWTQLRAGEHAALERLYRAHAPALLRYGRGLAAEAQALDAIQELYVRLWDRRERLPESANPRAYLITSLRHDLVRDLRREAKVTEFAPGRETDGEESVEFEIIGRERDNEQQRDLQRALNLLSARERELIELRFRQELDYDAISAVTGISYQSARNVLARAIGKLRGALSTSLCAAVGTSLTCATLLLELSRQTPS